jgi:FkbM family methyltransferase
VDKNPLHQFSVIRNYARSIGWRAAIRLRFCDLGASRGVGGSSVIELKIKNAEYPILMRIGSSDRDVLGQIFIEREYEPIAMSHAGAILDLGANVGYSSAYFLSKYPTATVVAVEPDPSNYAICCRNLKPFGNRAKVVHGAAWPERSKLVLDRGTWGDGREWATQVRLAKEDAALSTPIEGYDVPTLIALGGAAEIDLLKIDIERSELELFSRNTESWLPRVKNLCIELHGQDCGAIFFRALAGYSYNLSRTGELTVCSDLRVRGSCPAFS